MMSDFPRRSQIDLMVPAELAIREAMLAVENTGAHPLLTDAVVLLEQAKSKVSDFVDRAAKEKMMSELVSTHEPLYYRIAGAGDAEQRVAELEAELAFQTMRADTAESQLNSKIADLRKAYERIAQLNKAYGRIAQLNEENLQVLKEWER